MSQDPLTLLEQLEATKRGLKRGEHMNPAVLETFIAILAGAVVSVEPGRMNYKLSSIRDALLARLGKLYGIPRSPLLWDLRITVSQVQDEMLALDEQRVAEQVEELERQWNL